MKATPCRLVAGVIGRSARTLRRISVGPRKDALARLLAPFARLFALGGGEQAAGRGDRVKRVHAAHRGVTAGDRADRVHQAVRKPWLSGCSGWPARRWASSWAAFMRSARFSVAARISLMMIWRHQAMASRQATTLTTTPAS